MPRRWTPFLESIALVPERLPEPGPNRSRGFPWDLPCVDGLLLTLRVPVTFFVADNGRMTYPGAEIVSFDADGLERMALEETEQFQVTRLVLNDAEQSWARTRR